MSGKRRKDRELKSAKLDPTKVFIDRKVGEFTVKLSQTRVEIGTSSEGIKVVYMHSPKTSGVTPYIMWSYKLMEWDKGNFPDESLRALLITVMSVVSIASAADAEFVKGVYDNVNDMTTRLLARQAEPTEDEQKEALEEVQTLTEIQEQRDLDLKETEAENDK